MSNYVASYRLPIPVEHPPRIRAAVPPTPIPGPDKVLLTNAARHIKTLYPGPAGEVLYSAILAYVDMGYLGRSDSAMQRLLTELAAHQTALTASA